ncbi:MAG: MATE family efflux transporter, partial [Myxococcota bacterium]|nr:MATE family efflux transporter [Myxococcota bacterium]
DSGVGPLQPSSVPADRTIALRLVDLAAPIIGVNVLNVLALAVDTAMVGRTPTAEVALTGMGFATQLVFLLMVAMLGLTVGSVALVARAHGAGRPDRVRHILGQSSQLTVVLGLVAATLGNGAAPWVLGAMGASGAALDAALDYLRPLLAGSVFYYLTILHGAALRGVGNTRMAFAVAAASNLVNLGVNWCLVLGNLGAPALGIQGAAIGTVCAQAFSAAMLIILIRRGTVPGIALSLRPRAVDWSLTRTLARIGAPAACDMVVLNASFLSIVGMLGRLDPVAVAAHGIGLRIQALAFVPGMSISQATGAMVGNALGAGRLDEARAVVRASLGLCTAVMVSLAVCIIAFDSPIIGLFDVDPGSALGRHTADWMLLLGVTMLPAGVYISFVGMFQGAGATRISLGINVVATMALQIPLSWVLGFHMGLGCFGVWLAFPVGFMLKALLGVALWQNGSWARSGDRI